MSEQPSKEELIEFLEVFTKLERFAMEQCLIRGYRIFDEATLPIPGVVATLPWLRELAK